MKVGKDEEFGQMRGRSEKLSKDKAARKWYTQIITGWRSIINLLGGWSRDRYIIYTHNI